MQHIASRHAVVGIERSMASPYRFAPSTFLLHSLTSSSSSSSSSSPSTSRGARFFSCGRSPPSGLVNLSPEFPSDALLRNSEKQLTDLKGEIDAAAAETHVKEAKRESTPDVGEKAIILKSIKVLNEALKGLRATRDKLIDASIAAQVAAADFKALRGRKVSGKTLKRKAPGCCESWRRKGGQVIGRKAQRGKKPGNPFDGPAEGKLWRKPRFGAVQGHKLQHRLTSNITKHKVVLAKLHSLLPNTSQLLRN